MTPEKALHRGGSVSGDGDEVLADELLREPVMLNREDGPLSSLDNESQIHVEHKLSGLRLVDDQGEPILAADDVNPDIRIDALAEFVAVSFRDASLGSTWESGALRLSHNVPTEKVLRLAL
jgi:hypothetical protein